MGQTQASDTAPVRPARGTAVLTPLPAVPDPLPDTVPAPRMTFRQAVGRVLRAERQVQQRTLQDVADAAQVSLAFLSEIERGRKQPSSEVLAALGRALRVEVAELVARSADELRSAAADRSPQLRAA